MSAVSWIGAVGRAASFVLPKALMRILAGGDGGSVSGDEAEGSDHEEEVDREQVCITYLIGVSHRGLPDHTEVVDHKQLHESYIH
jgi:hypothetical protein